MMIEEEDIFEEGDTVEYFPVGAAMQTSVGAIKRIITESEQVGIQTVKASEDAPRYVRHKIKVYSLYKGHSKSSHRQRDGL